MKRDQAKVDTTSPPVSPKAMNGSMDEDIIQANRMKFAQKMNKKKFVDKP